MSIFIYMQCMLSTFSLYSIASANDIREHFDDLSVLARILPPKNTSLKRILLLRKLRDVVQFHSDIKKLRVGRRIVLV